MHALDALIQRWRDEGAELLPPESAEAIHAAFRSAGHNATPDIIEFYSAFGGMKSSDGQILHVWTLAEIRHQPHSIHGVVFADHMIFTWAYRLKPLSDSVSGVYIDHFDDAAPVPIANSLESFVERYFTKPSRTYAGNAFFQEP